MVGFGLALKSARSICWGSLDEAPRPLDLNPGLWVILREMADTPGASASDLARASFHTPQTLADCCSDAGTAASSSAARDAAASWRTI